MYRILLFIIALFFIWPSWAQEVSLVAGGDVVWDRNINTPDYYFGIKDQSKKMREDGWRRLPYLASEESKALMIDRFGIDPDSPDKHHVKSIPLDLKFSSAKVENRYPFLKIKPVLKAADITLINLETPLSDSARKIGAFRTPTAFAKAMSEAGVDIVNTANNHALDAEGQGLKDTEKALEKAGIHNVGSGANLAEARKPVIIEKDDIKFAFLGYTYGVNPTIESFGFALPDRSGVAPLDPFMIKEDIKKIKGKVDYIILSFHWGIENTQEIHPAAIAFAHEMIDAGADVIIGHHPHVPRGVEIYKGKPIIYSLGNFIFGHTHTYWKDNILARIVFSKNAIAEIEILPIAGQNDVGQPYLLTGDRAKNLLEDIKTRSGHLDTEVSIVGNEGIIKM